MKVAIMQPYFLPYLGYFQLIHAVDLFVVYDNIQYTKKGWINRNRFLKNGKDSYFSIPLKKDSDYLNVKDRTISLDFNKRKLFNQIREAYKKSPNFLTAIDVFQDCLLYEETNLFEYIHYSIHKIVKEVGIQTKIITSSSIDIDHSLKSEHKVLAICKEVHATTYINATGGVELYSKEVFQENGIELRFIKTRQIEYKQYENAFVPWLSIIDVIMFNDLHRVTELLEEYEVI